RAGRQAVLPLQAGRRGRRRGHQRRLAREAHRPLHQSAAQERGARGDGRLHEARERRPLLVRRPDVRGREEQGLERPPAVALGRTGAMARRHPILRRFAILAGVLLGALLLAGGLGLFGEGDLLSRLALRKSLGVVELHGVIEEAGDLVDALERFRKQDGTVGVVVRIDSPGGAVAPSQELYDEVWRVRAVKPVIASLGNVAASGGYYVASAANVIVADPGTITGSIGALMEVPYAAPLAEKI